MQHRRSIRRLPPRAIPLGSVTATTSKPCGASARSTTSTPSPSTSCAPTATRRLLDPVPGGHRTSGFVLHVARRRRARRAARRVPTTRRRGPRGPVVQRARVGGRRPRTPVGVRAERGSRLVGRPRRILATRTRALPRALAFGRPAASNICLTRGAVSLPDDELEALTGHEVAALASRLFAYATSAADLVLLGEWFTRAQWSAAVLVIFAAAFGVPYGVAGAYLSGIVGLVLVTRPILMVADRGIVGLLDETSELIDLEAIRRTDLPGAMVRLLLGVLEQRERAGSRWELVHLWFERDLVEPMGRAPAVYRRLSLGAADLTVPAFVQRCTARGRSGLLPPRTDRGRLVRRRRAPPSSAGPCVGAVSLIRFRPARPRRGAAPCPTGCAAARRRRATPPAACTRRDTRGPRREQQRNRGRPPGLRARPSRAVTGRRRDTRLRRARR